ncbi:MAG: hypothetical protein VYE68_07930 [Acidobacteriota bacterium]|nr:hypothetical protein [Acidobacteriota bacterium]
MSIKSARILRPVCGLIAMLIVHPLSGGAQTLDEVLRASLAASGGREALDSLSSVRQTGTFSMATPFGNLEGDTEVVIVPNQKIYQMLESDLFERESAWNGTSVWQSSSQQGLVDLQGRQAASLAAQAVLHPFLGYENPQIDAEFSQLDDTEVDGRPHHVVLVRAAGFEYSVFLDLETKLVSRLQFETDVPQLGVVMITADSSEYEEHGGVMFATRNVIDVPGFVRTDIRFSTTELNGEVDHSIFERP